MQALATWIAASLAWRFDALHGMESSVPASAPRPRSAASSPTPTRTPNPADPAVPAARPTPPPQPAAAATPSRLLGARAFLLAGQDDPPGFGAYGYLLLLAAPRDSELPRHLSVLAAWLRQYPTAEEFLRDKVRPDEISLVQLPVRYQPSLPDLAQNAGDDAVLAAARELLAAYDHARAQAVAARLSLRIAGSGPVLVTLSRPATEGVAAAALVENMSGVAPDLADAWLRAAMRAAVEPRTWSTDALERLALRMRNIVAQLAAALPGPQLQPDERVQLAQVASR